MLCNITIFLPTQPTHPLDYVHPKCLKFSTLIENSAAAQLEWQSFAICCGHAHSLLALLPPPLASYLLCWLCLLSIKDVNRISLIFVCHLTHFLSHSVWKSIMLWKQPWHPLKAQPRMWCQLWMSRFAWMSVCLSLFNSFVRSKDGMDDNKGVDKNSHCPFCVGLESWFDCKFAPWYSAKFIELPANKTS